MIRCFLGLLGWSILAFIGFIAELARLRAEGSGDE